MESFNENGYNYDLENVSNYIPAVAIVGTRTKVKVWLNSDLQPAMGIGWTNGRQHSDGNGGAGSRNPKVNFQKATDQEKINQLLYAFDYENLKFAKTGKFSPIDLDNYFSNLPINGSPSHYFEGYTKIDGKSIFVGADFVAYKQNRYPFNTQFQGAPQQYADPKWSVLKFYRHPHSGTHGHYQLSLRVLTNDLDVFIKRYELQ